jgi:valyl-tRNA synthetase
MSKSRGNDVDPLDLVEKHGTDSLRFTLTALAAPGTDPSLSLARLQGYRAFVNKLWNASRFVLMNLEGERAASYDFAALPLAGRWIVSRLQETAGRVQSALGEFRFDQAANELYHFVWDELCDWYIEASKADLARPDEAPRTRAVLLETLEATLRLLHPIVPYVTEEIWQRLPLQDAGPSIMVARFPAPDPARIDPRAVAEMTRLQGLVTAVRTIRSTYEVEPRRRIDAAVVAAAPEDREFVARHAELIRFLARVERLDVLGEAPDGGRTIRQPVGALELSIPMAGLFDVAAETARLQRERGKVEAELLGLRRRLDNPQFVERAKPELVAETRARLPELEERLSRIDRTLTELGGDAA